MSSGQRVLVILGLLLGMRQVAAYPSLTGPTGTAVVPDAAIVAEETLNIAVDGCHTGGVTPASVRALYGLTPDLEVGGGCGLHTGHARWTVQAKYASPVTIDQADLSAGVVFTCSSTDHASSVQGYLVSTRAFSPGIAGVPALHGSLGVNWTTVSGTRDANAVRAFLSAVVDFHNGLAFCAEYQTRGLHDRHGVAAMTTRYLRQDGLAVELGITNLDAVGDAAPHGLAVYGPFMGVACAIIGR